MKKRSYVLSGILIILASCATRASFVPQWVQSPPRDSTYEYFTASAQGKTPTEAEQKAERQLIASIARFLGVTVKSTTVTKITGDRDAIEAQLDAKVTQKANIWLEAVSINQKFFLTTDSGVTAWLLASYKKTAIAKERERIARINQEKQDFQNNTLNTIRSDYQRNDLHRALTHALQTLTEINREDDADFFVKIKKEVFTIINLLNFQTSMSLHQSVLPTESQSFTVQTAAHMPISISYTGQSEVKRINYEQTTSDTQGNIVFYYQQPFIRSGFVQFAFDFKPFLAIIRDLSDQSIHNALKNKERDTRIRFTVSLKETPFLHKPHINLQVDPSLDASFIQKQMQEHNFSFSPPYEYIISISGTTASEPDTSFFVGNAHLFAKITHARLPNNTRSVDAQANIIAVNTQDAKTTAEKKAVNILINTIITSIRDMQKVRDPHEIH